jgi:hypothetical protein
MESTLAIPAEEALCIAQFIIRVDQLSFVIIRYIKKTGNSNLVPSSIVSHAVPKEMWIDFQDSATRVFSCGAKLQVY